MRQPKITSKLKTDQFAGRIGVVFGNGPQIDTLSDDLLRELESDEFMTIGVNRIACAARFIEAGYHPDLHLVWDNPHRGTPVHEAIRKGLASLKGRTWRLSSPECQTDWFPHDQKLASGKGWIGPASECELLQTSCDAAVNVLYRLGIREVFLFGCELSDDRHCEIIPKQENDTEPKFLNEDTVKRWLNFWRKLPVLMPGLQIFCACATSRLVTDSVFPLGLIATHQTVEI